MNKKERVEAKYNMLMEAGRWKDASKVAADAYLEGVYDRKDLSRLLRKDIEKLEAKGHPLAELFRQLCEEAGFDVAKPTPYAMTEEEVNQLWEESRKK